MGNSIGSPAAPSPTTLGGTTVYPALDATSLLRGARIYRPVQQEPELGVAFRSDAKRQKQLQRAGRQYYGQHAEDCRVRALLEAAGLTPDGPGDDKLFLEMGALDGIRYSNTLALERAGWRGVLIEANPSNCRRLQDSRRSGRTINVCAGVCAAGGGPLEFEIVRSATSRMTTSPLPWNATKSERQRRIKVPCLPLTQVANELALKRINFFSLDVEGAEALVLGTMNWSVPIDVLEVEVRRSNNAAIRQMLADKGMVYLGQNRNDAVYILREVLTRIHRRLNITMTSLDRIAAAMVTRDRAFSCVENGTKRR